MQVPAPAPSPAPAAPQIPTPVGMEFNPAGGAREIYQGFKAQRRELANQLESLEERRQDLSQRLQEPTVAGADRKGIEARITEVDARISEVEKQIADADANVARSAAIPGATIEPPQPRRPGPPEEAFVLGGIFIVVVFFPLSIAYARRIWRRSAKAVMELPKELYERFTRLEQAVDAIAVEVERVGEGQRYVTNLMAEGGQRALGAGAAEPLVVKQRESVEARRP